MFNDLARLTPEGWAMAQLLIVTAVVMWVGGVRAALRESDKVQALEPEDEP